MEAIMEGYQNETPVSVGEWMLTMLIMCIPIIGLVMLFVWAFGGGAQPSKANWAKASLLWMVLTFVIVILFIVLGFGVGMLGALASR